MDLGPYDNVEFPIQRQGAINSWEGASGYSSPQPKPYTQAVMRDKVTSSLAPVFENDDGSENSELPKVEDQRQKVVVTPAPEPISVEKKVRGHPLLPYSSLVG